MWETSWKKAFFDPFTAQTGIQVKTVPGVSFAKLKAQVQTRNYDWDVINMGDVEYAQAVLEGLLEKVDPEAAKISELPSSMGTSLGRVLVGYAAGALLGVACGLLLGRVPHLEPLLTPTLGFVRSIPPIAFVPLSIILFGIGEASKYAIIVYLVVIVLALSTVLAGTLLAGLLLPWVGGPALVAQQSSGLLGDPPSELPF